MIKDVGDHRDQVPMTFIHVNRTGDAPFKEESLAGAASTPSWSLTTSLVPRRGG